MPTRIYTIGHSTRTADAFLALLQAHDVRVVADIRSLPRSARHPHFNGAALAASLARAGIGYRHLAALGGLRTPAADSINTALRHPAFRGYADHMTTADFEEGIAAVLALADRERTTVMCAEADYRDCHRSLLADALTVRGAEVWHIGAPQAPNAHMLSEFARVDGARVSYPGLLSFGGVT